VAECHTLKQRLGAFDHRLLEFLKDQMQDPESIPDAAVLAAVGGMRSAVKLAIDTAFLPNKASGEHCVHRKQLQASTPSDRAVTYFCVLF
jgi:hypothetical protein